MSHIKLSNKIFLVCLCFALLFTFTILTCSASAPTPTALRWCDYVKHEDTGDVQYIGKDGWNGFDLESLTSGVNAYYLYFNDITLPFNGAYADEVELPSIYLRDEDGSAPESLDIYGELTFAYYVYESSTETEVVRSSTLDIEVPWTWNNDSEEYHVWDISGAVMSALETLSGTVIDGLWVSISDFRLAIDVALETDVFLYTVFVETELLSGVYHGSLLPLNIPIGSGGGYTQEDLDNAFGLGFDEGKQEGLNEGYNDGYNEGYDIGFERGEDKGYNDGYTDGIRVDANIGSFLVSTVGDFLGLPILGDDFTVGHILLIVVTIPLVVWFLKLFAGG